MMSTSFAADPSAELLFGKGRRELLALLYARADQAFYLREIARLTGMSPGTVQRELRALERVGLVSAQRRGRQVFYRANRLAPVFAALHTLLEQTMGVPDLLRAALAPLADRIVFASVYGSFARGTLGPSSDIDVLVVGDVEFSEVTDLLPPVEQRVERSVNPTVYTLEEFRRRRQEKRHFLTAILRQRLVPLIGDLPTDARPVAPKRVAGRGTGQRRGGRAAARRGRSKSG